MKMPWCVAGLALCGASLLPGTLLAQDDADCRALVAAVHAPMARTSIEAEWEAGRLALEADSRCIPALEAAYGTVGHPQLQRQVTSAIATIGGPAAVEALRRRGGPDPDAEIEMALITAAGTAGRPEDIRFLTGVIVRDSASSWAASRAARALEFLRPPSVREALAPLAERTSGVALSDVRRVLAVLGRPRCATAPAAGEAPRSAVTRALLECITRPDDMDREFCDAESGQLWQRGQEGWLTRPIDCERYAGGREFSSEIHRVTLSRDGTRAQVMWTYDCGERCGGGLLATLTLVDGAWRVMSHGSLFIA